MIHYYSIKYSAKRQGVCDARELIGNLICEEIGSAIDIVMTSCTPTIPKTSDMDEIVEVYKEEKGISLQMLEAKKFVRPAPDKVFRKIKKDGVFLLVPASNALTIVLLNNLKKEPSLTKLIELVM